MTSDEQLKLWVAGQSVHNPDGGHGAIPEGGKGGECCPDFSCCRPELAWPLEQRKAFADQELRMGCCFDCASKGEERLAKRTVLQHVWKFFTHIFTRDWYYAKVDIRHAWGRLTRTGDYKPNGYFDKEVPDWRQP